MPKRPSVESSELDPYSEVRIRPELFPELDPDFFSDTELGSDDHGDGESSEPIDSEQTDTRSALAQMRKQLLDLTAHNPLISFKHSKGGRFIRLVDELPDNVTDRLLDGKTLTFDPVPDPTIKEIEDWKTSGGELVKKRPPVVEWAKKCKISTFHDLPVDSDNRAARRFTDSKLQTLHFPDILESRVSNLYRVSKTMVEETGTNPLHLVFGFLEWYEAGHSEKAHFSPLYTLPVALEKGAIDRATNTYQYSLRIREDGVQFNASIATRLVDDYAFVIPEMDAEQSPESYLLAVEDAIKTRFPRWKVHRWGTLAMLNFSRLLMFRDLDPDNWPEGNELDAHPLVKGVIHGAEERRAGGDDESVRKDSGEKEYSIDGIEGIYSDYPLVDVADSSQHSALIDAIGGKNLVIQGPPGTGKSQTITNLIAAALHQGKTVLFVSEKLAALSVVKSRMENLGLGDFCLELHSHNTKKLGVVESLRQRLEKSFNDTRRLSLHVERHGQLAGELNAHAERINRTWKGTELSIIEILVRCVRCWNELDEEWEDLRIEGLDGDSWHPKQDADTLTEFAAYAEQLEKISKGLSECGGFDSHPWRGVQASDLDSGSVGEIMSLLQRWDEALEKVVATVSNLPGGAEILGSGYGIVELKNLADAIASMPPENVHVNWSALGMIHKSGLIEVDTVATSLDILAKQCSRLGSPSLDEVVASNDFPRLAESLSALLDVGMAPLTKMEDLGEIGKSADELLILVERWANWFEEFREYAKNDFPAFLEPKALSLENLNILAEIIEMNCGLRQGDLTFRNFRLLPQKLDGDAEVFRKRIEELIAGRKKHEKIFNLQIVRQDLDIPALLPMLHESSALKRLFGKDYRVARKIVKGAMLNPRVDWDPVRIHGDLQGLEKYFSEEKSFAEDARWKETLGTAFLGVDTDVGLFDRLVTWGARLEKRFSIGEKKLFSEQRLDETGEWLLRTDERLINGLQRFEDSGFTADLQRIKDLTARIVLSFGHKKTPDLANLSDSCDQWRKVFEYLRTVLPALVSKFGIFGTECPETLGKADKRLTDYGDIRDRWETQVSKLEDVNARCFNGMLPVSPLSTQNLRAAVSDVRQWCEWLDMPNVSAPLGVAVVKMASADFVADLRRWHKVVIPQIEEEQTMRREFASFVSLDSCVWMSDGELGGIRARNDQAKKAADLLPSYLTLLRLRNALCNKGFSAACHKGEEGGLTTGNHKAVYQYLVTASLSDEIFAEEPALRRFDGTLHSRKQTEFRQCDSDLMKQTQIRTAAVASRRHVPDGQYGARVRDHTELALIKHEVGKEKRHLPLRQLLRRAGKATQALKPCFMMGPRSVAQYLQPGKLEFDLLVIDEASQMRPAEALGAVARCKQMVVVGDSKQLAPTSFFDRITSSDEDDEEAFAASVSESILDAVAPIYARRQLRWHYRSKHPSLIAFSNREFYDNRLMLFPSPHFGGEALGIRFQYVAGGVFENQVNTTEAIAVADRVVSLLLEDPSLSVGVATMNAKQRDLIERLLEDRAKNQGAFAEAWEMNRSENEPLFIKNLENVQGDEREVMIISCTYGRTEAGGRVMQRFGPINSAEGGRRLNVLFTRSKTRMEIFSSLVSSEILVGETSSDGVRAFRGILRYAETGIIEGAESSGREPDSDFEIAVAGMLRAHGYEVECQIGVAGFFIDLAVKHPRKNGEYILGVECDGAAYHSSKSARDRDRIRQDVLEKMGWSIERIWSTDWFMNPKKAIVPVLEAIQQRMADDTK